MHRCFLLSLMFMGLASNSFMNTAYSDEGMWLFNNPPRRILKERYDIEPSDPWLQHVQQSAVRFNSGGSGSFVSADGLVMTNHHVGADALQKLSTAEHDLIAEGFHAKTRDKEFKCVDLELNVLMEIEDVTKEVNAAVKPEMSAAEAQKARRAVMNEIEKASLDKTGLRSDVVTLYQGGQYHLYRYKKYTDVRLVFAPEKAIAFFGGDPDNFEYPRFDLDVCFFRVYENDKPAKIKHFLTWSEAGAKDNELVFVAGHPGRTDRLNTVDHLEFFRDKTFPSQLNTLRRREVTLKTFGDRSLENARRAQDDYFGITNSRKARLGGLAGLQDPSIMNVKREDEAKLLKGAASNPKLKDAKSAVDEVEAAINQWREMYFEFGLLEGGSGFNAQHFHIARTLLRLAEETQKPNADRLREYRESNLESLKQELFSEAPTYDDLEIVKLSDSLSQLTELLGAEHPAVMAVLDGKSPRERAALLIQGTKVADVATRKSLAEGGLKGIEDSNDAMLRLVRMLDPQARKLRKQYEEKVEEPLRQAYAKIAQARFVMSEGDVYPDATFTLRLAFGQVKGFTEQGKVVPPWTMIGGAYEHAAAHRNIEPFQLPESWIKSKDKLNLQTPFNFVSTADIIGGNSGSPVINRDAELVGIIFDGNIQSLVLDFVYTDEQARAVSVHSAGIMEALRKVYKADDLADELQASRKRSAGRASRSTR